MEITRRFMKFLEELNEPQVQDKYMNSELEENLQIITHMISKLKFSNLHKRASLNEIMLFEETVNEGCKQIVKKLKANIDTVSLLHTYVTNFVLNTNNSFDFVSVFCQSIFECTSISLISSDFQAPNFMKTVDGQLILEESMHKQAVEELDKLMADKIFLALDTPPVDLLKSYLASKNYIGNIVCKILDESSQFYVLLHFTKDSPFTGSYLSAKYYKDFPFIHSLLREGVSIVTTNSFLQRKESFREKIDALKNDILEIHKAYFLSYIATEAKTSLECDVATSIVIGEQENMSKKFTESGHKQVWMAVSNGFVLELKNNFYWDTEKLNIRLSRLWRKLHRATKHNELYHIFIEKSNDLFFEFSGNGKLIFQNKAVSDITHKSFVEIRDFLKEPSARTFNVMMGKSEKFSQIIQSFIQAAQESKGQITRKEGNLGGIEYEFIGRRKEGTKKLDSFSIIFKETKIDKITDAEQDDSSDPRIRWKLSKTKRMFSARNLKSTQTALGENADINALKKTIVSEYLPDDLTSNFDEAKKPHKSISSVNKIKLNATSKTAFIDSPKLQKSPVRSLEQIPLIGYVKPASLTVETFRSRNSDAKVFDEWSFDAVNTSDNIEKCRLVWAMLNDFGLIKEFNIDLHVLCEFILKIKDKYCAHNNAFHNFDHGITVMHGAFYILRHISTKFTNLVNLGILVSAFCHDADHTGRNNMFEVNTNSKIALRYHDKSVLEHHHAAVTFKILNRETSNIFSTIQGDDYKQLRKLIIANILATDMKVHFDVMSSFDDLRGRIERSGEESFTWNDDDVRIVTGMIVHCSDVCGPTKIFPVAYNWALRVNEEFTLQVREEEAFGIPVTPYFKDLDKPHVMAKQEIAFISFMIKPLWENFNSFFSGAMKKAVTNIESNIAQWKILLEDALKEEEEKTKAALEENK